MCHTGVYHTHVLHVYFYTCNTYVVIHIFYTCTTLQIAHMYYMYGITDHVRPTVLRDPGQYTHIEKQYSASIYMTF